MVAPTEPNYGAYTVCRPMVANIPTAPPGAVLTDCPYCGRGCWRLAVEPVPLPPGVAVACTECALKRQHHQRRMDRERAEKERTR